jgi:hypothetical protein
VRLIIGHHLAEMNGNPDSRVDFPYRKQLAKTRRKVGGVVWVTRNFYV